MKPATLSLFVFLGLASLALVKARLLVAGAHDFQHELLSTRMLIIACILVLCAAGCANIRAIEKRSAGQATAKKKVV